jgi:pyruvate dehydrogenase E2 component (dihydrolipoamide acetyltransferase)
MATDVVMPQMGESIAEGTIVKWLKKVGETIGRDEPLLEVSTDKVDTEVPSPAAGVLTEILHQEGETVAVNSVVARIGEAGGAIAPAAAAPAPEQSAPVAAPVAPAPVAALVAPVVAVSAEEQGKIRSSPLVRNIARENNVDLMQVPATGSGGTRVSKDDILGFIGQAKAAPIAAPAAVAAPVVASATIPAPAQAPVAAPSIPAFAAGERIAIEPMTKMRKIIADGMLNSRRTSAHVTTFFEADFSNIARLRERVKKSFEAQNGTKLTFLPFVIKATLDALKAIPVVNASTDGENIIYKNDYNVGIAVALDWGLIVPVIKHADMLSISGLARASQDLATRARAKQLKPDEVSGGTFSITNFGLYGGLTATPIINQPQLAILGLGGIHKKPWVVETPDGDALAIRHIGVLSLSFDHRIIDGAVGDQYLAHVKKTIETTDWEAML